MFFVKKTQELINLKKRRIEKIAIYSCLLAASFFRYLWKNFCYSLVSTILAFEAFVFTDSMPFSRPSFELYASLTAIISPLVAFSLKRYFPTLSLYHSKTGSGTISPKLLWMKLLKSFVQTVQKMGEC